MNQTPVPKPCVLDKLVKYFSEKYRGSEDYYGRRERVKRFGEKLNCNKIKQRQVTEKDLGEVFSELWVTGRGANLKRALEKHGLDGVLSKLEYLACRDEWRGVGKDVLKDIVLEGFGVATITELATCLYPEEFFIYNRGVVKPLNNVLIKKGIIREIYLPDVNKREDFWRMYEDIREVFSSILNIMKKYIPDANYLDVDAFLYDLHVKSEESSLAEEALNRAERECTEMYYSVRDLVLNALKNTKQVILYGVPGTGKTVIALKLGREIAQDDSRVEFVTFHSSYSYEEFIEGIRPRVSDNRMIEFYIEHGVFKRFVVKATCDLIDHIVKNRDDLKELSDNLHSCKELLERAEEVKEDLIDKALDEIYASLGKISSSLRREEIKKLVDNAPTYVLIIDEINRGDIAKIFGELITLLEKDKRLFEENQTMVILPYSKKKFIIPPNLYIIGTMNSADRSIALVDYALRRRFSFVELEPDLDKVPERVKTSDGHELQDINIREFFKTLNEYLTKEIDRDHRIGHSYFMEIKTIGDLRSIWFTQIRPLLIEYFYGRDDDLKEILGELYTKSYIDNDNEFIEMLKKALERLKSRVQQEEGS